MSLIEALIAAAILLTIALGLLPLFTRAILDNSAGNQATQATNYARSRTEALFQVPFDNQALDIPAGQPERTDVDSWAVGAPEQVGDAAEGWWPGRPTNKGLLLWTRETRVRQYGVEDLQDDAELDNPLPGGTDPAFVQLKEIEIRLRPTGAPGSPLERGDDMVVRTLKPF